MKKFNFSLERVLRVKEINEDKIKKESQEIYDRKKAEEDRLEVLKQDRQELCDDLDEKKTSPTEIYQLMTYHNFLQSLESHISNQKKHLEELEQEYQNALDKLIEAKKEKRVLEKLKERQKELHKQENLKYEQKQLDEISIQTIYSR